MDDFSTALAWLAKQAHENLGTELALRRAEEQGWGVAFAHDADGSLAGISVSSPAGQWFLEAVSAAATAELITSVEAAGHRPAKITTSGAVKSWLRPLLVERGATPVREHDLLAMTCLRPPEEGEGRWAIPADRAALERYQALYNEERHTTLAPDWDSTLQRPAVAVLERDGRIVAVVRRTADTTRYATIAGTWTDPAFRGRGLAQRLTAFLLAELLAERPAVHLIVDDDNAAAIALYRSLNFEGTGSCYMAYLP